MYQIIVNLGNRKEYLTYFGEWAGVQKTKEIGKCADVLEATMLNKETGEVVIHYENQKCVWADGIGEL